MNNNNDNNDNHNEIREKSGKRLKMGVYRIYDGANEERGGYVGYTRNLEGAIKRLKFELELNAHSNRGAQRFYKESKEPKIEIYDEYEASDDMGDIELDAHLQALMLKAINELEGEVLPIQS